MRKSTPLFCALLLSLSARRAWIEIAEFHLFASSGVSLSARRAWIEILISSRQVCLICVALRKESVDRNITRGQLPTPEPRSLSARRAWIEIYKYSIPYIYLLSLSARRAWIEIDGVVSGSADYVESLSARRAWIEIICEVRCF